MAKAISNSGKANTKILQCKCEHPWQNKRYGKGMRVMNRMAADKGYRCTVCGTTRS